MTTPGDYDAVRRDIVAQLKKPGYDDGSAGPVFVRLAWLVFLFLYLFLFLFSLPRSTFPQRTTYLTNHL